MIVLEDILRKLADKRWRELRRAHNHSFMVHGPGPEWKKVKEGLAAEYEEIAILQAYLGLKPE